MIDVVLFAPYEQTSAFKGLSTHVQSHGTGVERSTPD